jgi:hypothetical protein
MGSGFGCGMVEWIGMVLLSCCGVQQQCNKFVVF